MSGWESIQIFFFTNFWKRNKKLIFSQFFQHLFLLTIPHSIPPCHHRHQQRRRLRQTSRQTSLALIQHRHQRQWQRSTMRQILQICAKTNLVLGLLQIFFLIVLHLILMILDMLTTTSVFRQEELLALWDTGWSNNHFQ